MRPLYHNELMAGYINLLHYLRKIKMEVRKVQWIHKMPHLLIINNDYFFKVCEYVPNIECESANFVAEHKKFLYFIFRARKIGFISMDRVCGKFKPVPKITRTAKEEQANV